MRELKNNLRLQCKRINSHLITSLLHQDSHWRQLMGGTVIGWVRYYCCLIGFTIQWQWMAGREQHLARCITPIYQKRRLGRWLLRVIWIITLESFSELLGILGNREKCFEPDEFTYSQKTVSDFPYQWKILSVRATSETHEERHTKIDIVEFRSGTTNLTLLYL